MPPRDPGPGRQSDPLPIVELVMLAAIAALVIAAVYKIVA